jgi:hypothetical protein
VGGGVCPIASVTNRCGGLVLGDNGHCSTSLGGSLVVLILVLALVMPSRRRHRHIINTLISTTNIRDGKRQPSERRGRPRNHALLLRNARVQRLDRVGRVVEHEAIGVALRVKLGALRVERGAPPRSFLGAHARFAGGQLLGGAESGLFRGRPHQIQFLDGLRGHCASCVELRGKLGRLPTLYGRVFSAQRIKALAVELLRLFELLLLFAMQRGRLILGGGAGQDSGLANAVLGVTRGNCGQRGEVLALGATQCALVACGAQIGAECTRARALGGELGFQCANGLARPIEQRIGLASMDTAAKLRSVNH